MQPYNQNINKKRQQFHNSIRKNDIESKKSKIRAEVDKKLKKQRFFDYNDELYDRKKLRQKQITKLNDLQLPRELGEENLNKIYQNWLQLYNQELQFDHSQVKESINKIYDYAYKQRLQLFFSLNDIYKQIYSSCQQLMKMEIKKYFKQKYQKQEKYNIFDGIIFDDKSNGRQLGFKSTIFLKNHKTFTYYVKTHTYGIKKNHSKEAQLFDPYQLFVYKFLQKFNLGCEVDFFGQDFRNFYVATKDAATNCQYLTFSQIMNKIQFQEQFQSRQKEGEKDYSSLIQIISSLIQNQYPTKKELLSPTQCFINSILTTDLLSRILNLSDILTNNGNFGFIKKQQNYEIRIIDFMVKFNQQQQKKLRVSQSFFGGLLEGNGMFNYKNAALNYIFKIWSKKNRLRATKALFDKYLSIAKQIINQSKQQTQKIIQQIILNDPYNKNKIVFQNQKKALLSNVEYFAQIIEYNFQFFDKQFNSQRFYQQLNSQALQVKKQNLKSQQIFFELSYDMFNEVKLREIQIEKLKKLYLPQVIGKQNLSEIYSNWQQLYNQKLQFDHPQVKLCIKKLKQFTDNQQLPYSRQFLVLNKIYRQFQNINQRLMAAKIRQYFKQKHGDNFNDVILQKKKNGCQLGFRSTVLLNNNDWHVFYIKTHCYGIKINHSTAPETIDPYQLFVYKILQKFNIGCKVRFFGRDFRNFYVSTKDASTNYQFLDFLSIMQRFQHQQYFKSKQIHKQLIQIYRQFKKQLYPAQEELKQLTQNFIECLLSVDLISRLLKLSDVLTNNGNFGFIKNKEQKYQIRVIDFNTQINQQMTQSLNINRDDFKGLLQGNGRYNYSNEALYYIFKIWPTQNRLLKTKNIFLSTFKNANLNINQAEKQVINFINNFIPNKKVNEQDFQNQKKKMQKRVRQLASILHKNFQFFDKQFNSQLFYQQLNSQASQAKKQNNNSQQKK